MIRGGSRYDEIAGAEGISRERVRPIVTRSLERDDFDRDEHRRVQAARNYGDTYFILRIHVAYPLVCQIESSCPALLVSSFPSFRIM